MAVFGISWSVGLLLVWISSGYGLLVQPVQYCRLSSLQAEVPAQIFKSYACGECFYFIYGIDPLYSTKYHFRPCPGGIRLCDWSMLEECTCKNGPVYNLPEFSNESTPLAQMQLDPPLPNDFLRMTRDCCLQADACCKEVMSHEAVLATKNESRRYCPATWDGWQCFPATPAGTTFRGFCPYYSYGRALVMSVIDSNRK